MEIEIYHSGLGDAEQIPFKVKVLIGKQTTNKFQNNP